MLALKFHNYLFCLSIYFGLILFCNSVYIVFIPCFHILFMYFDVFDLSHCKRIIDTFCRFIRFLFFFQFVLIGLCWIYCFKCSQIVVNTLIMNRGMYFCHKLSKQLLNLHMVDQLRWTVYLAWRHLWLSCILPLYFFSYHTIDLKPLSFYLFICRSMLFDTILIETSDSCYNSRN